jgi:hypothetical protein
VKKALSHFCELSKGEGRVRRLDLRLPVRALSLQVEGVMVAEFDGIGDTYV